MKIANSTITNNSKPYIIAEMSGNHNGDINRALELIKVASQCGADAVKLQTYTAATITLNCESPDFQISEGLWAGKNLHQLYDWAHTPWEWHQTLFEHAQKFGIDIFSSPFDFTAVDFLEELNVVAYKIASFELVDTPLIEKVAKTGRPLIMSTGMANLEEIRAAVETAENVGNNNIALLHCISGYPTPIEQANLLTIQSLQKEFSLPIGLSDHTLGTTASVTAVALGARIIEKHFTLSRNDGGPDAAFSLEPQELKTLVKDCHEAYQALGKAGYEHKPAEKQNTQFRRSLYICKDVKKGDALTLDNIKSVRPGYGMAPNNLYNVLGKTFTDNFSLGTALQKSCFE